ncbi:MAG: S41 family peptidase, partial [Elusimicrobiota bacterium]
SAFPTFNPAMAAAAMPAASAALPAAALPASAAAPAPAPTAGAALRSISVHAAAQDGTNSSPSDARALAAASFDGAAVFALDHSRGIQALSQDEREEAYKRMEQAGQHPYWIGQNLYVYGDAAAVAHTADQFLSARGWTLTKHEPGASVVASRAPSTTPGPVIRGASGRTYTLVPGSDDIARDEEGRLYRITLKEDGRLSVQPIQRARPAEAKEASGLTNELLAHLVGTLQAVDEKFVEKLSGAKWRELVDKGLTAILKGLEEHHTMYYDQEAWAKYRHHAEGNFTGIGIMLDTTREAAVFNKAFEEAKAKAGDVDDDALRAIAERIGFYVHQDGALIKSVHKGSPGEKAGLRAGDVLVKVDGLAVGGQRWDEVQKKIQGETGSPVKIAFVRDGREIEVTATRAEIDIPVLHARMVAPEIGYLLYREFRAKSEDEVVAAIHGLQAQGAKKLILDLRGNPGGNLDTANNILANLLHDGAGISSTMHRGELASRAYAEGDGPFADMEKIVLVDGNSASGSELTAATLQDYGVTVVGTGNSYGKFSFQWVFPLKGGGGMRITSGRYYSGKGRSLPAQFDPKADRNIAGTGGVKPDVIVPMTKDEEKNLYFANQRRFYGEDPGPVADPVLDKAIEILSSPR